MRRLSVLVLALALPAAPASASTFLWATVNVCDTPGSPDAMGVRAGMPGNATRQRMYARFTAQSFDPSRRRWLRVKGTARSPWIYVGSARFRLLQAGWTFTFRPPRSGVFLVRAVAAFEWRERRAGRKGRGARWVVAMRRRRVTRGGIRGVDGGDPPGTSRGACYIT
jgi:hypothetical protein